jgi:hypothetical protein
VSRVTYAAPSAAQSRGAFRRFVNGVASGKIRATKAYVSTLPSGRTHLEYNDPGKPVSVFNVAAYNGDYQAALTDALAANGVLEWPPQTKITGSTPIILTKCIELRGFGRHSHFDYTGTGDPVRALFADSDAGQGTHIHDLRISARNAEGQNGISFNQPGVAFPREVHIHNVEIDGVANGDGIFMHCPINCIVERNKIQGCRRGVAVRTPCGTSVDKNWINYWANAGVHAYSVLGDGLAARSNRFIQNIIHGDPEQPQDVAQDRAGTLVDGVSNSVFDGYQEDIDVPPGSVVVTGPFFGHAIVFKKTGAQLTSSNEVRGGYFGPNVNGDAVVIGNGCNHTTLRRMSIGAYVVRDNGAFTYFDMVHMSDRAVQLQGSGTQRRGWISNPDTTATQLHT